MLHLAKSLIASDLAFPLTLPTASLGLVGPQCSVLRLTGTTGRCGIPEPCVHMHGLLFGLSQEGYRLAIAKMLAAIFPVIDQQELLLLPSLARHLMFALHDRPAGKYFHDVEADREVNERTRQLLNCERGYLTAG